MSIKPITLSTCAVILLAAVPSTAHAQSFGDLVRDVKRAADALEDAVSDDRRGNGDERAFPGDILIPARSPLATGAEHVMLLKVNEPVTEAGSYRFILRDAGSRGQRGVRHTSYLSDKDLDARGYVVVRFKAPDVAGDYELQVTREEFEDVLGSTSISLAVDPTPTVSLPATVSRGERIPVEISGDRYYFNKLSFVRDDKTVKTMQFDQIVTEDGEHIVAPSRRGRYEVYITYGYQQSEPRSAHVGTLDVR